MQKLIYDDEVVEQFRITFENEFLGRLCADLSILDRCTDVDITEFSRPVSKKLFSICQEFHAKKNYEQVVPIMLRSPELEMYYDLIVKPNRDKSTAKTDARVYVDRMKEYANKKKYEKLKQELDSRIMTSTAEELKEFMFEQLNQIKTRSVDYQIRDSREILKNDLTYEGTDKFIATGYSEFDSRSGGGFLCKTPSTILAPSGVGKTSFMVNCAVKQSMAGKRVMIISQEMEAYKIITRQIAILLALDVQKIRKDAYIDEAAFNKMKENAEIVHDHYIDDRLHVTQKQFTLTELVQLIDDNKDKFDIIYCDYIGLVIYDGKKAKDETAEQKIISETIKYAIKRTDMAWVWLSQVTVNGNPNDITSYRNKGSKQLEHDSATMVMLFKNKPMSQQDRKKADEEAEERRKLGIDEEHFMHFIFTKTRDGIGGEFCLPFDGGKQQLGEYQFKKPEELPKKIINLYTDEDIAIGLEMHK